MKISIVGSGYVGLVSGACFADVGINTTCIDIDKEKIAYLKKGIVPIYEPGLEDMVKRNLEKGYLSFTTEYKDVIENSTIVFIAVGTPPDEDGSADLQYVLNVAENCGKYMKDYLLVVVKSTVPVGTSSLVRQEISKQLKKRNVDIPFDVASNPEFLKEGAAIEDFLKPERIIIGVDSEKAEKLLRSLYRPFTLNGHPIISMDTTSAELTKYASNAMLATRISFMNDIANLCEIVGANVNMVRLGMSYDSRIGNKFLYPGVGYGGSCFPKDVKALYNTAKKLGYQMRVIEAVEKVNNDQKKVLFNKVNKYFNGDLKGKTIALWGLSFKPLTDDMREAPSLVIIENLLNAGANVVAYDPVAMDEAKRILGDKIKYANSIYEATVGAHCLLIVTEWREFRYPNFNLIKENLINPVIFDGRNIYDPKVLANAGIEYFFIGGK
ncbi:MAG: UDP-glucose/GDP-mannose dehydrogenase family protein [Bacteroidales bacterium]